MRIRTLGLSVLLLTPMAGGAAADSSPLEVERQIRAAVSPAPEDLRDGASVLGYSQDGQLISLKEGDGDLICLGDNPADERFHVACYFKELDPFMARGRELRAEGKKRDEVVATREAELKAGTLKMPSQPTALYSYTGPVGSFDPETGEVSGANHIYVVYIPYATGKTTGLSEKPVAGEPWLMAAGKPWAHIMLVQAPPDDGKKGE